MRIVPRSLSWRRKVRLSLLMDTTVPSYWVAAEAVATATESERTRAVRRAMSFMAPMVAERSSRLGKVRDKTS
jgi:hypothetical protein